MLICKKGKVLLFLGIILLMPFIMEAQFLSDPDVSTISSILKEEIHD